MTSRSESDRTQTLKHLLSAKEQEKIMPQLQVKQAKQLCSLTI